MDLTQYDALLNDAETRLDRLRALYDQFFQGLERTEPTQLRKDFERILVTLRKEQPRNTALRFRFQQLVQRNVTLDSHWRKVLRQIEDGTYRRDVLRARRRRQGRGGDERESLAPNVHEIDLTMDVDGAIDTMLGDEAQSDRFHNEPIAPLPPPSPSAPPPAPRAISPFAAPSLRPSQPPPALASGTTRASQRPAPSKSFHPPKPDAIPSAPRVPNLAAPRAPTPPAHTSAVKRPPPPPPPAPRAASPAASASNTAGYSEQQMRQLFDRYVNARKTNNERVDNVRMESLQKTVEAMMPKLREKHGQKQIDFDVIVRDGKVALKPITK